MIDSKENLTPILVSEDGYTNWCRSFCNDPVGGYHFVDPGYLNIIWVNDDGLEEINTGYKPGDENIQKSANTHSFLK